MAVSTCYIFAGPSRYGLPAAAPPEVRWLGPVRRGSIEPLLAAAPEVSDVAIVDGLLGEELAIDRGEILQAIRRGYRVWGLSSTGAVLAAALRGHGMRGFGRVYRMFETDPRLGADEVALLHGPVPPYRPATEPLVHIRVALDDLVQRGVIGERDRDRIIVSFANRPVNGRTLVALEAALAESAGPTIREYVAEWLAGFDRFRIKQQDLADFLRERPWTKEHR